MESITKNRQTPGTLRAMVARAYGPGQVIEDDGDWVEELGHGWFNVAYRIRLRDGRFVVLKIAPPPDIEVMTYERGAMATELAALRLIAEQTTVPVPNVDFADQSHELCDADYFFMPFIEGENLGTLPGISTYRPQLGAINRQLNEIRGNWFGALQGPGEATWRACFLGKIEDVLGDGERQGVDLGYGHDFVREAISARADALDEVVEPRFVEWDLFPLNALVRDGEIVCVIDHERAFYGDPLIEAGFVGIDLPDVFGDPAPFMRGYGQGELSGNERRRRWLYTLYLALIMVIETKFRQTSAEQYQECRARLDLLLRTAVPSEDWI